MTFELIQAPFAL